MRDTYCSIIYVIFIHVSRKTEMFRKCGNSVKRSLDCISGLILPHISSSQTCWSVLRAVGGLICIALRGYHCVDIIAFRLPI